MSNFDKTATSYSSNAFAQSKAAEKTLNYLKQVMITDANVIDLGCGSGEHTNDIANMTSGNVLGIDISDRMISIAKSKHQRFNLEFQVMSMENISVNNEYDCAFANSSFYYIRDRLSCYRKIYKALTDNGFLVVQASYRDLHSKQFMLALNGALKKNSHISKIYDGFHNPVFLYPDKQSMIDELTLCGLKTIISHSEEQTSLMTIDDAMKQFESNAFPSILNPGNYDHPEYITEEYCHDLRKSIRSELAKQVNTDDKISIILPRIYIVAAKDNKN